MAEALLVGAAAASTLLLGAAIALVATPSPRTGAVVMAVGAGVLIGSVSYELVDEALASIPLWQAESPLPSDPARSSSVRVSSSGRAVAAASTPPAPTTSPRDWRSCSARCWTGCPSPSSSG